MNPTPSPERPEPHAWGCAKLLLIGPCNCHLATRTPAPEAVAGELGELGDKTCDGKCCERWASLADGSSCPCPICHPPTPPADKDAEIISRITRLHELLSADEDMQGLRCAKILGFIPANQVGKIHGKQVQGVQEQKGPGGVQESTSEKEERPSDSGVEEGEPREIKSDPIAVSAESSQSPLGALEERGPSKEAVPNYHPQRDLLGSIEEAERLPGLQEITRQNPGSPRRLLETIRRGLAMCSLPHSEAPKIFRGLIEIEGLCCEIARLREEFDWLHRQERPFSVFFYSNGSVQVGTWPESTTAENLSEAITRHRKRYER